MRSAIVVLFAIISLFNLVADAGNEHFASFRIDQNCGVEVASPNASSTSVLEVSDSLPSHSDTANETNENHICHLGHCAVILCKSFYYSKEVSHKAPALMVIFFVLNEVRVDLFRPPIA